MLLFSIIAKTVGLVVPMDHAALTDIVQGFKKTLDKKHTLVVKNAMGDPNLQRSIIQSFVAQKMDLIVPIGTAATQMSTSIAKKNILGLASYPVKGASVLEDEVSSEPMIKFMKQYNIKKLALVYSHNEKILPEVELVKKTCKELEINIQLVPVYTTQDLYAVSKHIKADGIFILKDHMVVSALPALLKLKLPIFASDEGSVKDGALCAIGVTEADIGVEGAKLANQLLDGKKISEISKMKDLKLFTSRKNIGKSEYKEVYCGPFVS